MPACVSYLCLQPTQEGQASHAHVHEIVAGLRRRGHRVRLFEPPTGRGERGLLVRLLRAIRLQALLCLILDRSDVLYVRFHPASLLSVMVARAVGTPIVVEVNGTPADFVAVHPALAVLAVPMRWAATATLRSADAAIAVTDELAEWVRGRAPDVPVTVVPNAANPELFQPVTEAAPAIVQDPYVCFVGALSPWQGLDVLFEAASHPDWPESVRVRVAGDGPLRGQVEEVARRDPRISYEGVVPYPRVGPLVSGSLAAVSLKTAAAWHASPLKVFEAMAAAVPVVVSDQPGQSRIVQQAGCGLVVPTGDAAAVAKAVRRLHEDPALRLSLAQAGHAAAREQHTWDQRAAATARVIRAVQARRLSR